VRYWDASALIPLLVKEADTSRREAQLREDAEIVTWWATRVECASAMNRLARAGDLQEEQLGTALEKLEMLAAGWIEVLPSDRVKTRAMRLLRVHPLRAADALQLAACLTVRGEAPSPMAFLCADTRLRAAADKEGLTVPR
jgi:predicted nucleic acid-binding protein